MGVGDIRGLLLRVRQGDGAAAEELVRAYEPELRRVVRVRMTDARLRQIVDSIDICQSVLAVFFVRTAAGQFDIQSPEDLIKLLVKMARNCVIDHVRRAHAERRDERRNVALVDSSGAPLPVAGKQDGPVTVLVNRDLLEQVRVRLTAAELQLMDQRSNGQSWNDIAAKTGEHPNVVRMRLARALDRVSQELGLDQPHE